MILAQGALAERGRTFLYGVALGRRHRPLADHGGYGVYAGDLVGLSAVAMGEQASKCYLSVGDFEDPAIDAHGADAEFHFEDASFGAGIYWKAMEKAIATRATYSVELLDHSAGARAASPAPSPTARRLTRSDCTR